jgi:hypothetical protein
MAGLINSNILRDSKTPLSRISASRAPAPAPVPFQGSANPGAYYDEAGYHPGTPTPGSGGYYDESGSYHPGAGEGSHDEAGWHPPKEAPTLGLPGQLPPAPAPASPSFEPDWDAWANTPWSPGEQTPTQVATQNATDAVIGGVKGVADNYQRDVGPVLPTGGEYDWDAWSKTPWDTKPSTEGELSDPGTGEVGFAEHGDEIIKPGDPNVEKWIDKIGNRESLGAPDLDAWYDREWKRAQGSLNAQAAARGMHGSTDAMRMLHQAREGLAADQAKESADFAMKSFNADTDRYKLAAALSGEVSAQDLEEISTYLDYALKAQGAEEGRIHGKTDDLFKAFNLAFSGVIKGWDDLLDADKEIIQQIITSGPADETERQALEARLHEGGKAALAQAYKMGFGGVGAGGGGAV